MKEQYGSTELDGILVDLRSFAGWAHEKLDILERTNNKLEEALVSILEQNGRIKNIKRIPRKHLSDLLDNGMSVDDVIQEIKNAQDGDSEYITYSYAINALGYNLFRQENGEDALRIFKLNTELYPERSNPWDSYAMCLIAMGKKEEGIKAYRKFVELSPLNQNAKRKLEELERIK